MIKSSILSQLIDELERGVLIFKKNGTLYFCNRIAARLLNLSTERDPGKKYQELFLTEIPNTALNKIIEGAFASKKAVSLRSVPYRTMDGKTLGLNISTKFVRFSDINASGGPEDFLLIYVAESEPISAGTTEAELLNAKFKQLEQAYLYSEERNRDLQKHLKRIEWLKIGLMLILFTLFSALIYHTRQSVVLPKTSIPTLTEEFSGGQIVTVKADTMIKRVTLSGKIDPHLTITLTAQSKGKVIRRIFDEGDIVDKDHILYELDRRELAKQVRSARVNYMQLLEKYNTLQEWENGLEVKQAERKFELARIALADEKKKLEETKKLFNKGIIPRIEYEQAQTAYKRKEYDFQDAKQSLEQIRERGSVDKLEVLRLQLFNAREDLDELERQYEAALVRAPVSGVVMRPRNSEGNELAFKKEGDMVSAGDLMAMIGATDSYMIHSVVGELMVNQVQVGQQALIRMPVLPEARLTGKIQWVANQAIENNGLRYFPVRIVISDVPDSIRQQIRLGMLAEAGIEIEKLENVLTIPVEAVIRYQGENKVYVVDSLGQKQLKTITPGFCDTREIIIEAGLDSGAQVLIPTVGIKNARNLNQDED